jgi:hypothetical protein
LLDKYADLPMDFADALVPLAKSSARQCSTDQTAVYQLKGCKPFVLPND